MIKLLFLIWLLLSNSLSASLVSRQKSTHRNTIKSKIFGISESKVVPGIDNLSIRTDEMAVDRSTSLFFKFHEKKNNVLFTLPDTMIQEIFEYLIGEYASIRLTSRHQRKTYDDFIYRITCNNFPVATVETFSRFIIQQYKLIPLSRALFYNIKIFMPFYNLLLSRAKDVLEIANLREESLELIRFLRVLNIRGCLMLTDSLLKLKIISWTDIYLLMFFNKYIAIIMAWSLGLTTIAREMSTCNQSTLIHSMNSGNQGILAAIRGKHYALSRFLIVDKRYLAFRAINEDKQYLNGIIAGIIEAKFWDLLYEVYHLFDQHHYSHHLIIIAKQGDPEGLRILKSFAVNRPHGLGHIAATNGHLEFLKELDSMGLLLASSKHLNTGESAVHTAAFHGRTECLEFLIDRLGSYQMGAKDSSGYLPIHLASQSNNPETLKAVIRLYPFYRHRFPLFNQNTISPLLVAVPCGATNNARILLQSFPELIYLKEARKETAIHLAITKAGLVMLEMLLDFAPPKIIRARNSDGNTALHLAAKISDLKRVSMLMETGHFTGFERNNLGLSPVYYFSQRNDYLFAMEIFNLDSDQLVKALRIKKRNLFNY